MTVAKSIVGKNTVKSIRAAMPGTRAEIAARLNRDQSVIIKWIVRLHKGKTVHISGWVQAAHGGAPQPIYSRGKGVDAPRPVPRSEALKSKLRREREKAPPTPGVRTRWMPWHPWNSHQHSERFQ